MDAIDAIPYVFQVGLIAVVLGNILWYWIKAINKFKGYRAHLFTHSGNFRNFKEIIKNEEDVDKKRRYHLMLKITYVCIAFVIISFIAVVVLLFWGLH